MGTYVCNGAQMKCSMGDNTANLSLLPDKMIKLTGQDIGNIMDNKPLLNIPTFGQCQSLVNPTVSAATAANSGKLQPMPCIPNTVAPWMPGNPTVLVKNQPALMKDDKLMCIWAGIIEFSNDGQGGSQADAVNSRGHEFDAKGFGNLFDIDDFSM